MNDDKLNEILKSASVPERAGEYWEKFPGRVIAKLHWRKQNAEARQFARPRASGFRFLRLPVFGAGLAVACILLGFGVGFWKGRQSIAPERAQLAEALKCYREIAGLFPNQIQSIVFDQKGAHLVLAEQPNVPASTPLYVKICGSAGCQRFVTFSGQQIQVNGDTFDVLVDRRGDVMVVGAQSVWSSSEPLQSVGGYRIEARPLPAQS
jgi:hypothetical protein